MIDFDSSLPISVTCKTAVIFWNIDFRYVSTCIYLDVLVYYWYTGYLYVVCEVHTDIKMRVSSIYISLFPDMMSSGSNKVYYVPLHWPIIDNTQPRLWIASELPPRTHGSFLEALD